MLADFRKIIFLRFSSFACLSFWKEQYVDDYEYITLLEWYWQEQRDLKIKTYLKYSLVKDSVLTVQ